MLGKGVMDRLVMLNVSCRYWLAAVRKIRWVEDLEVKSRGALDQSWYIANYL